MRESWSNHHKRVWGISAESSRCRWQLRVTKNMYVMQLCNYTCGRSAAVEKYSSVQSAASTDCSRGKSSIFLQHARWSCLVVGSRLPSAPFSNRTSSNVILTVKLARLIEGCPSFVVPSSLVVHIYNAQYQTGPFSAHSPCFKYEWIVGGWFRLNWINCSQAYTTSMNLYLCHIHLYTVQSSECA